MANRTQVYAGTDGVAVDVMSDERTVSTLSDNNAAKVQYVAEIDGTPDGTNVAVIDSTGAKKVVGPTLTKGTQGATGMSVQALKDAGRTSVALTVDAFAIAGTTEVVLNIMSVSEGLVATATNQSAYVVPSGKRFRITAIGAQQSTVTGNTTTIPVVLKMRGKVAGTAGATDPIQLMFGLAGIAAANAMGTLIVVPIPDGFEVVAADSICFTETAPLWVVTTASPKVSLTVFGFLY